MINWKLTPPFTNGTVWLLPQNPLMLISFYLGYYLNCYDNLGHFEQYSNVEHQTV